MSNWYDEITDATISGGSAVEAQRKAVLDQSSTTEEIKNTLKRVGDSSMYALRNVGLALGQGMTFGTYDEVAGFLRSLRTGEPVSEAIEAYRAPLREFRKDSPITAYSAEIIGGLPMAARTLPSAAAQGFAYGMGSAEGDVVERLPSGVLGGLIGAGAQKLLPTPSPQALMLKEAGVPLTAGQTAGGSAKTLEEALTSFPIVGTAIKRQQRRATDAFNVAAINEALKPLGQQIKKSKSPRDAMDQAIKIFDENYAKTLNPIKIKVDDAFLNKIVSGLDEYDIPADELQKLTKNIKDSFINRAEKSGGFVTGQQIRKIKTSLGDQAQKMRLASGEYSYSKSMAQTDAVNKIMDAIADQYPKQGAELKKLGEAYARFSPVREAAFKSRLEGAFTPKQLLAQVQRQSIGNKRAFLRGEALQQELAEAGAQTLSQGLPDSGTATRSYLLGGLGTGGTYTYDPLYGTIAGAGLLGGQLLYTPAGQYLMKKGGSGIKRLGTSRGVSGLLGVESANRIQDYMNVSP